MAQSSASDVTVSRTHVSQNIHECKENVSNISNDLSLLFDSSWNPAKDGFKRLRSQYNTKSNPSNAPPSRFLFIANSCEYDETPNKEILYNIFSQYGKIYDIFITQNKPFVNIAFVFIKDAINAQYKLNNKQISILNNRRLHVSFSMPNRSVNVCALFNFVIAFQHQWFSSELTFSMLEIFGSTAKNFCGIFFIFLIFVYIALRCVFDIES